MAEHLVCSICGSDQLVANKKGSGLRKSLLGFMAGSNG